MNDRRGNNILSGLLILLLVYGATASTVIYKLDGAITDWMTIALNNAQAAASWEDAAQPVFRSREIFHHAGGVERTPENLTALLNPCSTLNRPDQEGCVEGIPHGDVLIEQRLVIPRGPH